MFELDDGLEEFGDAAGEIAEEEIEDAVDDLSLIHISEPTRPY